MRCTWLTGTTRRCTGTSPSLYSWVNLGRKTKMFAKGTRRGVAEPYTGEARPLSQGALLAVQQELAARQELDTQAAMATAEGPLCRPPRSRRRQR